VYLARRFGAPGAAVGTTVALIIAAGYLLVTFHRNYLESSVWIVLRDIQMRPIMAGVLASFAAVGFHQLFPQVAGLDGVRYLIPLKLAMDFAVFSTTYFALLIALHQVTALDWENFIGLISFGSEFLRHPFRDRVKIYR
jgi:hypothetical protein